jgi:cytochrome c oxidase assembly protein Cox11
MCQQCVFHAPIPGADDSENETIIAHDLKLDKTYALTPVYIIFCTEVKCNGKLPKTVGGCAMELVSPTRFIYGQYRTAANVARELSQKNPDLVWHVAKTVLGLRNGGEETFKKDTTGSN